MKVKALCNILHGGNLYRAGDVFEVDENLKNTEPVIEAKPAEAEKAENATAENATAEKTTKRR